MRQELLSLPKTLAEDVARNLVMVAKLLDEDPEMYQRADRWIEAADWIIWQLCGGETRNACTAGYKGIYQDGRYPSADFLTALNPAFGDFAGTRLARSLSALCSSGFTHSMYQSQKSPQKN